MCCYYRVMTSASVHHDGFLLVYYLFMCSTKLKTKQFIHWGKKALDIIVTLLSVVVYWCQQSGIWSTMLLVEHIYSNHMSATLALRNIPPVSHFLNNNRLMSQPLYILFLLRLKAVCLFSPHLLHICFLQSNDRLHELTSPLNKRLHQWAVKPNWKGVLVCDSHLRKSTLTFTENTTKCTCKPGAQMWTSATRPKASGRKAKT